MAYPLASGVTTTEWSSDGVEYHGLHTEARAFFVDDEFAGVVYFSGAGTAMQAAWWDGEGDGFYYVGVPFFDY